MGDMDQTFILSSDNIKANATDFLGNLPPDGTWQARYSEVVADKTLKQLGALFGLWTKEEAERMGESVDYIHRKWKAKFLARIYAIKQMTGEQESWVELLVIYQEAGDQIKLQRHARRISLSWAKLPQMKEYMQAIEQHYIASGRPLTVPDPLYKTWRRVG